MNVIVFMKLCSISYRDKQFSELKIALQQEGFQLIFSNSSKNLLTLVEYNPQVCGVIFDWNNISIILLQNLKQLNEHLPLYIFINKNKPIIDVKINRLHMPLYFLKYDHKAAYDIALYIKQCTDKYINIITPPLTKALFNFIKEERHTFCTPGHMGGIAFKKSPVGNIFYDFLGPNILKADISISVKKLGSLLFHTGPHLDAEKYIASTFGAENSYIVTNGTSTSNKIVGTYSLPAGSTILIDRNCHQSLTHLLMMIDIVPVWLKSTRNALGMSGGIPKSEFTYDSIQKKINDIKRAKWPAHAVITTSTYDGLLYNTNYIKQVLDVSSIHFDSAWAPYTKFHPIYLGKSCIDGERIPGKVIYETQSMHKLLTAFSQSSLIHIKGDYDKQTFNEVYMMYTSTSPNYAVVSSTEIAAAIVNGNWGKRLINNAIETALHFRREIRHLQKTFNSWFFDIWQPDKIDESNCWPIQPGNENWHGFTHTDYDHVYLDPIKVTVLTPGLSKQGKMDEKGIPASLVAMYLEHQGIIVEKTGLYNILLLFSIGIDKTKEMTILRRLIEFKNAFDSNLCIENILPNLYAKNPIFYSNMRIQTLAQNIHQLIIQYDFPNIMLKTINILPEMKMTPYMAFQHQVRGHIEVVELCELIGNISASMIIPYPPGVPMVMPGEMVTEKSKALLDFILMLCAIGKNYPGFATDIHGITLTKDKRYLVRILR